MNINIGLIFAAESGNLINFKRLIRRGADICYAENRPFINASMYGRLNIIKYLCKQGVNIHAQNDYALKLASCHNHLDIVKYLIGKGANIHADNDAALRWASDYYHLEVVKYLVSKGADITEKMNVPKDVQEIAINNNIGNIKYIKNLRSDLKEKYKHLLQASGFGLFSND
jgi:ankyrin repeat protein